MSSDLPGGLPAEQPPDPVGEALRMRASDADREKVADVLREAYAEGRLTRAEHEERLAETYQAMTYGDLIPVMRDLPVPPGTLAIPGVNSLAVAPQAPPATTGIVINPALASKETEDAIAIFSGFKRSGAWTVPPEMSAVCVFGGGELDLTEAVLTSAETVVNAVCIFGGLEVTVPEGMVVRSEVVGVFGGTEVPKDSGDPGAPVLVVKGAAIFGGVEIHRPKKPKKWTITRG